MSIFLAILEGDTGCDYSIKCGVEARVFVADDDAHAQSLAVDMRPLWSANGDRDIRSIRVFAVDHEVHMDEAVRAEVARLKAVQSEQDKAAKRAIVERLKKELGE